MQSDCETLHISLSFTTRLHGRFFYIDNQFDNINQNY